MGREVEKEPISVQRRPPSICPVRTVCIEGSLYLRIQDTGRRLAIARPHPFSMELCIHGAERRLVKARLASAATRARCGCGIAPCAKARAASATKKPHWKPSRCAPYGICRSGTSATRSQPVTVRSCRMKVMATSKPPTDISGRESQRVGGWPLFLFRCRSTQCEPASAESPALKLVFSGTNTSAIDGSDKASESLPSRAACMSSS